MAALLTYHVAGIPLSGGPPPLRHPSVSLVYASLPQHGKSARHFIAAASGCRTTRLVCQRPPLCLTPGAIAMHPFIHAFAVLTRSTGDSLLFRTDCWGPIRLSTEELRGFRQGIEQQTSTRNLSVTRCKHR